LEIASAKILYGDDLQGKTGRPWKGRAYLRAKYPGAFPLSESQIEVLEGLAKKGPTNAYKVAKITGKAYSFVFNSLKELKRRKMIILKGKEKTEKGTTANIYDLALDGVLLILHREMSSPRDDWDRSKFIRTIIERYGCLLPLVFGKWAHFERMKVEKTAMFRLKVLVDTYSRDRWYLKKGTGIIPWMESEEQICWFFYFQFNHFNFEESWLNALKKDKEIHEYVIKQMRDYQKNLENIHKKIEENILFIESLDEKEKPS